MKGKATSRKEKEKARFGNGDERERDRVREGGRRRKGTCARAGP